MLLFFLGKHWSEYQTSAEHLGPGTFHDVTGGISEDYARPL